VKTILVLILSYLLGSVPIGFLVGDYLLGVDIRQHGSGNIGATNVFRILGIGPGLVVFVGDLAKGVIPVLAGKELGGSLLALLAGLAAIIGHNWSLFLGFKGGRGVATGAGVIFALSPLVGLIAFFLWAAVVMLSRYVSLGSIVATMAVPVLMFILHQPWSYVLFGVVIAILIVYRHRPNMKRLLNGTEAKIGQRVR
jgi:glycerol-3-phosphate acyltransferase PlsY